jgi:hypothetical protein
MSYTIEKHTAASSSGAIADSLMRNGGVIIQELVTREVIDKVRMQTLAALSDAELSSDSELWPKGNRTTSSLPAHSPLFVEALALNNKVLEVMDIVLKPASPFALSADGLTQDAIENLGLIKSEVIEDDARQIVFESADDSTPSCSYYRLGIGAMLEVGEGMKSPQPLHRETAIYQPFVSRMQVPEFLVSTMWAGTDFTKGNGATRVVPGSHEWPEERIARPEQVQQAEMPTGSVVLWLSRTLHGAAPYRTGKPRAGFFASYVANWLNTEENQYVAVPPEAAARLSERGRQLVGYRCSRSIGWVKGRDQNDLLKPGKSGAI